MLQELLFEIGSEEIPASYIEPALLQMKQILAHKLSKLNLSYKTMHTAATPRRLTVCVEGLISRQPTVHEEVLGPPKKVAFDADNQPTKAATGFVKSKGASLNDLKIVTTSKGEYLLLSVKNKGRDTMELLPNLLAQTISEITFPKSMCWGTGRISFARPIKWLTAIYNSEVVSCKIEKIPCGRNTLGHRFMSSTAITINDYNSYLTKLRENYVIADIAERRQAVRNEITRAAKKTGGHILPDDELINTVTNLVEIPYGVCGDFSKRFLSLPREVLITSMREHQKYFAVVDKTDKLLPHFIAVNNTKITNTKMAAKGHQRVLQARLSDALFFFKGDRESSLEQHVPHLHGVIFQAKLGSMLDKTNRLTLLAGYLSQTLAPTHLTITKRAAHLSKADLLTAMVNEFPSLEGVIGHDYAILDNESPAVATAILEHYMPRKSGTALPTTIAGGLISLADRFDTIIGCFGIGKKPTGTTDPFGLRRLALGALHIITAQNFSLSLSHCIDQTLKLYDDKLTEKHTKIKENVLEFIKGRFVNDLANEGLSVATIEAVTSITFDDIVDCRKKIKALAAVSSQPAFTILAGSFKRVMNIIKENTAREVKISLMTEAAEKNLHKTLKQVTAETHPLLRQQEYNQALTVMLTMKEPIDNFFDHVMVMVDNPKIRDNRLALLTAVAKLFLRVGDFSKMY